jgi:hypothetical protein
MTTNAALPLRCPVRVALMVIMSAKIAQVASAKATITAIRFMIASQGMPLRRRLFTS